MGQQERLVAVISPWEKLAALVKQDFRVESLPKDKQVMVWREDLQTEKKLAEALKKLGIDSADLCRKKVTTKWQSVE